MKKLRRKLAAAALTLTLLFGAGSLVRVQADGPQGQKDSRSGAPSAPSQSSQADLYLLWLIIMWLLGWL